MDLINFARLLLFFRNLLISPSSPSPWEWWCLNHVMETHITGKNEAKGFSVTSGCQTMEFCSGAPQSSFFPSRTLIIDIRPSENSKFYPWNPTLPITRFLPHIKSSPTQNEKSQESSMNEWITCYMAERKRERERERYESLFFCNFSFWFWWWY